jgi:hypothetical protein
VRFGGRLLGRLSCQAIYSACNASRSVTAVMQR